MPSGSEIQYIVPATMRPDPAVWAWEPYDPQNPPPPVDPSFFDWIPCLAAAIEFERGMAEIASKTEAAI